MRRREAADRTWCAPFRRDRHELLPLLRLADDSEQQILASLRIGEILYAAQPGQLIGCAHIIATEAPAEFELKSIAVIQSRQRQGIGGKLVRAAARYCRAHRARRLVVSTSIAASDAVAFYLSNGFRICGFIRDAFTGERGYPPTEGGTRLPLNDAVVFELLFDHPNSDDERLDATLCEAGCAERAQGTNL